MTTLSRFQLEFHRFGGWKDSTARLGGAPPTSSTFWRPPPEPPPSTQAICDQESKMDQMVNGWQIALDLGRYGTKYRYRAAWTFFAVGGNLVEDASTR